MRRCRPCCVVLSVWLLLSLCLLPWLLVPVLLSFPSLSIGSRKVVGQFSRLLVLVRWTSLSMQTSRSNRFLPLPVLLRSLAVRLLFRFPCWEVLSVLGEKLSAVLSAALAGCLSSEELQDEIDALGVWSCRPAAEVGFYDPEGSSFLVSFSAGGSVLVSFQDRPY